MAAVLSPNFMEIPGFGRPLGKPDLEAANALYNGFVHINDQPTQLSEGDKGHITALLGLISKHQMGDFYGIHSVHRHYPLPGGTVRLEGEDLGIEGASWTRAAAINDVDMNDIHPTLFKLAQGNLVPVEFAVGASPAAAGTGIAQNTLVAFLDEVVNYLLNNPIGDRLALEIKDFAQRKANKLNSAAEIEIQWGNSSVAESFTVVIPLSARAGGSRAVNTLTPTGWNVFSHPTGPGGGASDPGPDPEAPPAGVHYEPVVIGSKKGTHKVVKNSFSVSGSALTAGMVRVALANMGFILAAA